MMMREQGGTIEMLPEHIHTKNRKIIDHYGLDHQLLKLTEECGELIQIISKYFEAREEGLRAKMGRAEQDLKMEMADVAVLFDRIKERIHFTDEELHAMADYKIDRQIGRMKAL